MDQWCVCGIKITLMSHVWSFMLNQLAGHMSATHLHGSHNETLINWVWNVILVHLLNYCA